MKALRVEISWQDTSNRRVPLEQADLNRITGSLGDLSAFVSQASAQSFVYVPSSYNG